MKVSKKILENRENMTYFEKNTLRYVIAFGLLFYLIYHNMSNAPQTSVKSTLESQNQPQSDQSFFEMLRLILKDMQRELLLLFVSVGGYVLMAKVNNYLDKVE